MMQDDAWINSKGRTDFHHRSKLADLLIVKDNDIEHISKDQCFLLAPCLLGFALDIKSWSKCAERFWDRKHMLIIVLSVYSC